MADDQTSDDVSTDDVLETERPDTLNSAVGNDPLSEDNDPPAAPADTPGQASIPDDHPVTDTDVDPTETYQGGSSEISPAPAADQPLETSEENDEEQEGNA
ncbi:MAG TPA: hypothetical protein VD706_01805 [Candidatus Saccharimonadales bacterium]|nr:hypothetical protein [Candidatus Saccharimonadales bacterium]